MTKVSLSLPQVLLLYLCTSVLGTSYSFRDEPQEYYYAYPNNALMIHCEAVETRDDGTEQLVDVVIFKNSERINSDRPPSGLLPLSTKGYITGIMITPIRVEDSGSTYQCKVEVNGEEVLSSLKITLYVGDGLPLAPKSNPVQTGQSLTTVTIDWGKAPAPAMAPLLGYTIIIIPIQRNHPPVLVETWDNQTMIELCQLVPGEQYRVKVFGWNSNGNGTSSQAVVVSTVVPQAPTPPKKVQADLVKLEISYSINISWTGSKIDNYTMTPIEYFIIFYGARKSSLHNVKTSDNMTTTYVVSGIVVAGNYIVGVAAVNSAGRSTVTFYEDYIEVPSTEVNLPAVDLAPQTIVAIGVVVSTTSVLLILTIIILVLLIIYLRRKTSQITANLNQPNESDNSPSAKKNGHSSPKIKQYPLRSNGVSQIVELDDYDVEPRRAGSQPPEQSDFSKSTITMDSSLKV